MSFVRDYLSNSSQQFFTTVEAALLLDVHPSTIRRWVDDKRIQARITLGGHRRIAREVLLSTGASCNHG